jgi:hypothetical protein
MNRARTRADDLAELSGSWRLCKGDAGPTAATKAIVFVAFGPLVDNRVLGMVPVDLAVGRGCSTPGTN